MRRVHLCQSVRRYDLRGGFDRFRQDGLAVNRTDSCSCTRRSPQSATSPLPRPHAWSPPDSVNRSLLIAEGDSACRLVIGSLSSDAQPHPANDASTRTKYEDQGTHRLRSGAHALTGILPPSLTPRILRMNEPQTGYAAHVELLKSIQCWWSASINGVHSEVSAGMRFLKILPRVVSP